jgi:nucleoid DNA-binding protein
MDRTSENSVKPRPIKVCSACGSSWFRKAEMKELSAPQIQESNRKCGPIVLVCLCGTPFRPRRGGVCPGRTAKLVVKRFFHSLDRAAWYQQLCRVPARQERALSKDFVRRDRLRELQRVIGGLERRIGRLLPPSQRRRYKAGRHWRLPTRKPATKSKGRDWLTIELQQRGLTFDEARKTLAAIIGSMTDRLKDDESVESPLGEFRVVEKSPKLRFRIRLGGLQRLRQKKVVVFKPAADLFTKGK